MLDVPLAVLAAIMLSTVVVVAVTSTGLHRTPVCALAGLGVTIMLWMAYPPAHQLPHVVGLLFWVLMTWLIYVFPEPDATSEATQEEELLDRFFERRHP